MKFLSTRSPSEGTSLSQAIQAGLAPDGGLYVPERVPSWSGKPAGNWAEVAQELLAPFFEGDTLLAGRLPVICRRALDFPIPLVPLAGDPTTSVLELFHGPTAAFKDVGARFLA